MSPASATLLIASGRRVFTVDAGAGTVLAAVDLPTHPACLASDPLQRNRAWCGTDDGILRSLDDGISWQPAGLEGENVTALAASPVERGLLFAGTEPSALWISRDGGASWERAEGLLELPSSPQWSFPPKPDTHHVRWIGCHPSDRGRLWLAIEAGALVTTPDGGATWFDKVAGGPYDTHQLAIHPARPDWLRSAAGDGYFESRDGGASWASPEEGLEVGYLVAVAVDPGDPEVVVVSAASHPFAAYRAGRADGRLYRRQGHGPWQRVLTGWPDPPSTVAPRLAAGHDPGELWAADERGVHRSGDGGRSWQVACRFDPRLQGVSALALTAR